MCQLFLKTSSVKQYSYENDFSGVFDALHESFLVYLCIMNYIGTKGEVCRLLNLFLPTAPPLPHVVYATDSSKAVVVFSCSLSSFLRLL